MILVLLFNKMNKKNTIVATKNVDIKNSGEYISFYNDKTLMYEFYDKNGSFVWSVADEYEYEYYLENPEMLLKVNELIHDNE